jgi:hypothetical protein
MARSILWFLPMLMLGSCSMPPIVNGNYSLSENDVAEIKQLVLQRSDTRKPILRIFADRPNHALVDSGRQGYVGNIFNSFAVAKRHGRWQIDSKIEEEHIIVTAD